MSQKRKYLKVQEYQEEISESVEDLRAESGRKLCFEEVKNSFLERSCADAGISLQLQLLNLHYTDRERIHKSVYRYNFNCGNSVKKFAL